MELESFLIELRTRLLSVEQITGAGLADLLSVVSTRGRWQRGVLNVVHEYLLQATVAHARRHVPHYRDVEAYASWNHTAPGDEPSIDQWPLLDRETVSALGGQLIATDANLRSISHTSGTTGLPLEIWKSHEEIAFIQDYYNGLFSPFFSGLAVRPLSLSFPNSYHGHPVPMPSVGMAFVSGVTDDTLITDALRVLQRAYSIPGFDTHVSSVTGLQHHVLFFTSYLLENGIDPASFRLAAVNITGGFTAKHWREFLADSWQTLLNDRYTLTETIGGASRCLQCEHFHLDPHLFAEVVDVDTGASIVSGVGEMVVTNLYPLVQMQPLIRYRTGDLIRRFESVCGNTFTFEFLGRCRRAISRVVNGEREWLIFSAHLNDVLSAVPDLNVYDWFANVRTASDRTVGSLPIMAVSASDTEQGRLEILLEVELMYAPKTYSSRLTELTTLIVRQLREATGSSLAAALDDGSVTLAVEFYPPDRLNRPIEIKI